MYAVDIPGNEQPYLNFTKSQNVCLFKQYASSFGGNINNHIDTPFFLAYVVQF